MKLHLTCNNYVLNAYSLLTFATFYFFIIGLKWAFDLGQTIKHNFNLAEHYKWQKSKTLKSKDKSNHKWTQTIELKIQGQIQPQIKTYDLQNITKSTS
jgi:hypothetical protein